MQQVSREMEGGGGGGETNTHSESQVGLEGQQQQQNGECESQQQYQESHNDDFLEQMLSNIPNCSWPPTTPNHNHNRSNPNSNSNSDPDVAAAFQYPLDEQMSMSAKSLLQQWSPHPHSADGMLPLPLSLDPSPFKSQAAAEASVQALYNGLAASLRQPFHPPAPAPPQMQGGLNCGGPGPPSSGAPQRQRVRARRGQATDPHSIAERLRRERIAERMKALQELVPNANKTDKASMLDEIIDYVKFLQLQVKVLSMSRLGGAAAVAPLVADMTSEGGGRSSKENQNASTNDSMTVTEHQVAKLMEEDMGSAMQYLQGKGLCLMPISLATAISTATSLSRTPLTMTPTLPPHSNDNNHHHHPLLLSITSGTGDNSVEDPSNS